MKEKYAYEKGYRITKNGDVVYRGRTRSKRLGTTGYFVNNVRIGGKLYTIGVHRMQAYEKFGDDIYIPGIVVRHLNNIKTDNSWDNISIGTQSQNMQDNPKEQRLANSIFAASFLRKYDKDLIMAFHKSLGGSYKNTMDYFGISSKGTLHYILNK